MADLSYLSIKSAHELLKSQQVSARELVQYYLDRIENHDPIIKACLTICGEQALKQADELDKKIAGGGELGLLEGIPYTAKDMFLTRGIRTTAASKILKDFIPPYSATVINKLDEAGAILLAKVNQDEFAQGSSTENSSFHPTHNPWNLDHVTGGTSGGSAAAVAADFGIFSLGTDTGGSIRQPAAYCGVTGLKPTYGLVSRYGVVATASSLDVIGPLARQAEDVAVVLNVIAGQDKFDSTTIEIEEYDFVKQLSSAVKKIGVASDFYESLEEAMSGLSKIGQIEKFNLSEFPTDESLAAYYIINPSEISSNLERYDGIRYGSRANDAKDILQTYQKTRGKFFGEEVKRRNLIGTYALSAGYYDAYYKKAMQVRTLIRQKLAKLFNRFDVLVTPTTLVPAFRFGEKSDPIDMYKTDILTVTANLAGIPAISIPVGLDSATGLPLGLQIMAPQGKDSNLLAAAHQFQMHTDYHKRLKEIKL